MVDVEEGELVDHQNIKNDLAQPVVDGDAEVSKQEELSKNRRRRGNKKNTRRKRVAPGSDSNSTDVNGSHSDSSLDLAASRSMKKSSFVARNLD